ncbi:phospholipase D-like domain-containing protein [Arsenicitalea aurantiaca]|uniref:phospholipase D-like domain-containing protein n=1 Tax=Arsenicitalea aurantiaca TaxID=1783274 RepID=UPI001FCE618E|nr:phospholipase D-like domain-containing protein [Arsenicitalea aurantiaca]
MAGNDDERKAGLLREGETCWRVAEAEQFAVIVDAAAYFRAAKRAILAARHSVLLIGWDFDARNSFEPDGKTLEGPNKIGRFLTWIAKRRPELNIYLLKWDLGMLRSLGRGETPLYMLRWMAHGNITMKLDGAHPKTAAHHMKILVVDDAIAFCGGIDMTTGRWDTRDHLENNPARRSPFGRALDPWHDATTCVTGPAARALGELARDRWRRATSETLPAPPPITAQWPEDIAQDFASVPLGIARTFAEHNGNPQVSEIEKASFAIIAAAERTLYIESQYLASRPIARALAARLAEPDGPEIFVLNPLSADGWLEAEAMDSARIRLLHLIAAADRHKRFSIWHPLNAAGTPIYVHAKIMIADDRILRIGSANLNNRSMGYDSECDLVLDARLAPDPDDTRARILAVRNDLLAEHLGTDTGTIADTLARTGSIRATIAALDRPGSRRLVPLETRPLTALEKTLAETDLVDPERPVSLRHQIGQIARRITGRR